MFHQPYVARTNDMHSEPPDISCREPDKEDEMIGTKVLPHEILEKLGEVPIRLDLALSEFAEIPNPQVGLSIPACLCGSSLAGRPTSLVGSWKRRML
jgi:hypothetical protein